MPLPQLTQPPGTPPFLAAGHAVEERAQFAPFRPTTGHSRTRRVWTASDRVTGVQLYMTTAQTAEWFDWYEGALQDNGGIFSAEVASEEETSATTWWEASFVAPPQFIPSQQEGYWTVSGQLLLRGDGQTESPYTGLMAAEVRVGLEGSVAGTVVPTMAAEVVVALEQVEELLLAAEVVVALEGEFDPSGGRCTPYEVRVNAAGVLVAGTTMSPVPDTGSTFDSCRELV